MNEEIETYIDEHLELLDDAETVDVKEADRRAFMFNKAVAILAKVKRDLGREKIKAQSLERVAYTQALTATPGEKITEKKLLVESNTDYIVARESFEYTDNEISYIKVNLDVFANAHIHFRTKAKGIE